MRIGYKQTLAKFVYRARRNVSAFKNSPKNEKFANSKFAQHDQIFMLTSAPRLVMQKIEAHLFGQMLIDCKVTD